MCITYLCNGKYNEKLKKLCLFYDIDIRMIHDYYI